MQSGAYEGFLRADAVTPNDVTPNAALAFLVSVGGTVTFRAQGSSADVQITAVAGFVYPIAVSFIRAAGTGATGIVALN
jgi:hypothetical protein